MDGVLGEHRHAASFTEQASDTIAPTGPWHSLDQLQRILRKYQRLSRCAVKNVLAVAAMACPQQVLGARAKAVSRRETDDADLAQPFDAERIDGVVWLVNENDLDVVHVSVHRHMIFGNVRIHANFVGARRLALGRDQTRGRTEQ